MLAIWNFPDAAAYRYFGLLHILAAIVAFGPMFVYPALRRAGDTARLAKLYLYMSLPALILVWVFGMGLVGMAPEGTWEMSQAWVVISLLCFVAAAAVGWFLIRPAITPTTPDADKRFSAGVGVMHLILVVALVMMIFKPGAPAGF